jgi:hypothetical protein
VPHLWLLMAAKESRRSASLPVLQIWLRQTYFCFREAKSKPADLPLSQAGLRQTWRGCPNQQQKRVRRLFAVDRPLWTVRPKRCWGGLIKSWNSWISKMFCIEVISPCLFYSEHTSYFLHMALLRIIIFELLACGWCW